MRRTTTSTPTPEPTPLRPPGTLSAQRDSRTRQAGPGKRRTRRPARLSARLALLILLVAGGLVPAVASGSPGAGADDPSAAGRSGQTGETPETTEPGIPEPAVQDPEPAAPDSEPAAGDGQVSARLLTLEEAAAAAPDDLRPGAEYRQRCIAEQAYDRCLAFFEELAARHPDSAAVRLNWGYAYVDKIPDAGAVTQVILADTALKRFTEALEIEESWLALYTRGNSYVYWPAIFGRTRLGIADLEKAVAASEELGDDAPPYHAHAYAALGDAHWRLDDLETARAWWRQGLERFPGAPDLEARLALDDVALDDYLDAQYAIGERVETDLEELWQE